MPEATLLSETPQPQSWTRYALYCGGFAIIQAVWLAAALGVASTQWFFWHDNYPGLYQMGYALRLNRADCDVVVYGDSSALSGLDPAIIQKISGLRTCNISEGVTIQDVVGSDFALDTYLAHNKRPKFLLTSWSPSGFQPERRPFDSYQTEGVLFALHNQAGLTLYKALLKRPMWLVKFGVWAGNRVFNYYSDKYLFLVPHSVVDTRSERAQRDGIWPFPLPAETHCVATKLHRDPTLRHADSVAAFRRKYGVDGTQVIVDISPVPTCEVLQDIYRKQAEGLHDNAFEVLPIGDFNEGDVHFSAAGGRYISTEAGEQILQLETERKLSGQADAEAARVGR